MAEVHGANAGANSGIPLAYFTTSLFGRISGLMETMRMNTVHRIVTVAAFAAVAALAIAGCSSSSSSPSSSSGSGSSPTTPTASPSDAVATNTITISNNVATPKNIRVARGTQVTIINNDTRSHNMTSNPHPEHTECPEINSVGFLSAGQTRATGNMVTNRAVCGFHDHDSPDIAGLQGSITIQ